MRAHVGQIARLVDRITTTRLVNDAMKTTMTPDQVDELPWDLVEVAEQYALYDPKRLPKGADLA